LLDPAKQQQLLTAVSSALQTDPGLDLLDLAARMQGVAPDKVTFATIPITGTPTIHDANGNPVAIVAVDFAALPAFIGRIVGRPDAYTTAKAADPGTVTVQVVNGSGRSGRAAANSAALTGLGFKVAPPANGSSQTATTITYPSGMEGQAKAVAAHVPGATVSVSSSVQQVTLTLGTDGHQVATGSGGSGGGSSSPVTSGAGGSAAAKPSGAPQAFTGTSCIN
jgi:hypothetical protein